MPDNLPAMTRKSIAMSLRTAAQLPSIPETQRQLSEGRLDAQSRLSIAELDAMRGAYVFAIVTTHERWEVVEVLDALGLPAYCPAERIVVAPKGKRQDPEHWRRWRAGLEAAGFPLAAVIDHSEKGPGSVLWPLSLAPDFAGVNLYYWPYEGVTEAERMPEATRIERLSDTREYRLATGA